MDDRAARACGVEDEWRDFFNAFHGPWFYGLVSVAELRHMRELFAQTLVGRKIECVYIEKK